MVSRGIHDRGNDQASLVPFLPQVPPRVNISWQVRTSVFVCAMPKAYMQGAQVSPFSRRPLYAQTTGIPCRSTHGVPASCLFAPRRIT